MARNVHRKEPWGKWFWDDWTADEAVAACSLAAQGLWMRMLCVCAKSRPPGFLTLAARPCTVADIAKIGGVDNETASNLVGELARKNVFSRTRNGTIYCRRMVRDSKKAATARKNGSKRGAVTTGPPREIRPLVPQLEARSQNQELKISVSDSVAALARGAGAKKLGPNFADPEVRKARWMQKAIENARAALSKDGFEKLLVGLANNEAVAMAELNRLDRGRRNGGEP